MITLCKNRDELAFLPSDAFAARITALALTYGFEQNFALFWVQKNGDEPVAAISRVDGSMTVCCTEKADFEELAAFINAVGYSAFIGNEEQVSKLGFISSNSSYIVEYQGKTVPDESGISWDCEKKKVYDLLCDCGFEMGDYGAFLADYCSRLNKGTARLAAFEENDLLACASALFIGEKSVLLGAVATRKSARGRGLASKLVTALAEKEKGKKVFLFCRNDGLLEFYKKIGFVQVGRWGEVNNQ